jgi:hypothetical protein
MCAKSAIRVRTVFLSRFDLAGHLAPFADQPAYYVLDFHGGNVGKFYSQRLGFLVAGVT